MQILPKWGDLYDEPFGDSSGIPTLLVSRVASESVKVVLSADGGDELFSGYNSYTGALAQRNRLAAIPPWLRLAAAAAAQALPLDQIDGLFASQLWPAGAGRPFMYRVTERLAKIRDRLRTRTIGEMFDENSAYWSQEDLRRLLGWDGRPTRSNCDIYPGEDGEKLCLWDLHHYLPGDILTKVDRATMAVSIEGREPLLDHRLVEFAFALPFRLRRGARGPKHLLRQVLYKYVPRDHVDRPKQGFGIPLHHWLTGDMRILIDQYLEPGVIASQGVFDPGVVQRLLALFRAGSRTAVQKVWLLLAFQMWHARWMSACDRGIACGSHAGAVRLEWVTLNDNRAGKPIRTNDFHEHSPVLCRSDRLPGSGGKPLVPRGRRGRGSTELPCPRVCPSRLRGIDDLHGLRPARSLRGGRHYRASHACAGGGPAGRPFSASALDQSLGGDGPRRRGHLLSARARRAHRIRRSLLPITGPVQCVRLRQ